MGGNWCCGRGRAFCCLCPGKKQWDQGPEFLLQKWLGNVAGEKTEKPAMETTSSCGEGAGRTALHLIEIEE